MKFERLCDMADDWRLPRGTIIRMAAAYPYEDIVDFMVVVNFVADSGMSLLVASGYKAGLTRVRLPKESGDPSISVLWLKENWHHWVYPEFPVEGVWIAENYPVPTSLPKG